MNLVCRFSIQQFWNTTLYYWSKVIRVRTTVPVTVACRAVVSKTVVNGPVPGNTLCCSRFQPRADAAATPDTLLGAELFSVAAGTFSDVKRAKPGLLYVGLVVRQNLRAYRYSMCARASQQPTEGTSLLRMFYLSLTMS